MGTGGEGVTAAAAAAAYRIGCGAGRGGSPAFRILAIGCCAKLGFGGGFATLEHVRSSSSGKGKTLTVCSGRSFCRDEASQPTIYPTGVKLTS